MVLLENEYLLVEIATKGAELQKYTIKKKALIICGVEILMFGLAMHQIYFPSSVV